MLSKGPFWSRIWEVSKCSWAKMQCNCGFFININDNKTQVDSTSLCYPVNDACDTLPAHMDNQPGSQNVGWDSIAIFTAVIVINVKSYVYLYALQTTDKLASTLANFGTHGLYAWDSRVMTCAQL